MSGENVEERCKYLNFDIDQENLMELNTIGFLNTQWMANGWYFKVYRAWRKL